KDIEKATNVPYLGDVPIMTGGGSKDKRGVAVRENGRDNISEAFRIIRTNLGFIRPRRVPRALDNNPKRSHI
ncbi:MAG: hypothetical protein IKJ45_18165, partial [Kiritimatiellae bacterium]|nr:hypothetical protein [Kiritimatiellia bacterium]